MSWRSNSTSSGTTTDYIRDPYGNLIALHDANGSHYYTTDTQGTVILITNTSQAVDAKYTYDPSGNPTSATGTYATINPWRYASGYLDPTGYTKLGARYYNPTTGRFTQPDPSHQEANNYTYAKADPANHTDPTGLDGIGEPLSGSLREAVGVVGVLAGAASILPACGIPGIDIVACGGAVSATVGGFYFFSSGQDEVNDYFENDDKYAY